jgi:predicted nucleic acid-binding protein
MESFTPSYCLDACAVIAYLRAEILTSIGEPGIAQPQVFLAIHACNLGELYYDFFREDGLQAAQTACTHTLELPLELRRDADDAFIQRDGTIKVVERVSLADAFALALSEGLQVPLVTTDHHEFDAVERRGDFRFLWLR